jgi:fibronectin-binding autotransporter adhesin
VADRYWVGGSGSWNSTTKWSSSSGGASGASVPTSVDNAIFDANSGSGGAHYTVTVTASSTCANLTFTPVAADGVTQFSVDTGFVIAGTFSTSGTQGNRRAWFRSSTYGLMRDMQIATIGTVTDVDFRDIRVTGAGGTLSGTRIGNLRGCRGITFSAAKSVYWVTAGGGNWSGNNWAASSGGAASTDNFPLAQDTAIIENTGLNASATVTMDSAIGYAGTVTMSTRTNAMTLSLGAAQTIYGDWTNGSGTTLSGAQTLTFSGRNTQNITSASKTFAGGITVDSYGGTVQLADALNIGSNTLTVTNGTFDTKNYNVTAGSLSSSNSNVRTISLGSSTVTLSSATNIWLTGTPTNLTLNAGTSTISLTNTSAATFAGGGLTFYNVTFAGTTAITHSLSGANTFNNLTVTAPASAAIMILDVAANQTITGTLTVAGATAIRRIFLRSDTIGTTRTLTVNSLSADDCDFRDITIAGTAAGSSPTRAGDCGGNSGITFPGAKTVYWNLAGTQNWSATGWATSSGGAPATNNFPLAQDTAVFDNTGSAGTVTIEQAWNIGTFDASARTSAMTLTIGASTTIVYGDWKFGTGVTSSSTTGIIRFGKRGTSTITSNGIAFGCNTTIDCVTGTVNLADALSIGSTRILRLDSGTFDAVSYNVTAGAFSCSSSTATLKMGSGTWTLSGDATIWTLSSATFYKGTANITFSDTSTSARTFAGGGFSYNKLTIGGTTGTSTLTISGNNQFTELASTKTVAHTIALGTTTQTFGKWSVTGTVGNVVTLTGTGTSHVLAGACTSGIDYLAMGSIGFAATSPGEFYAGANSTATAAVAPVYLTAKPADSTRYWVGGTGNWSDTARWSTSSGGASGAAVPRSHDDVVFDSSSNATGYTATVNAVTGGIRCKALTIAGPASGNLTLAGSTAIVGVHGNVTLPATGLTRTYTGTITLSSSSTGLTFTTNGVTLASAITVNGVDCGWTLGSALNSGTSNVTVTNGSLNTGNYSVTAARLLSTGANSRTITLGSSSVLLNASTSDGVNFANSLNLTFNAGTSTITDSANKSVSGSFEGGGNTFYNVSFTGNNDTVAISGQNTFNNLSIASRTGAGVCNISFEANQTVTGTLTFSAGTNATMRTFVRSDTLGTTRTLTVAAFSGTDVDFRDITVTGAAAPISGTRLGDAKGNSGITFVAGKTVYVRSTGSANWSSSTGWSATSGGAADVTQFPLAQDTAVFPAATYPSSGSTITIDGDYNIGTIDMSLRTSNTVTLATSTTTPAIYGNWINGTGTTLSGTGTLTFAGRGSQTITSAGKAFTQNLLFNSPSGSVTLQDAFTSTNTSASCFAHTGGTFDANSYNVTLAGQCGTNGSATRTLAFGSGTWALSFTGIAFTATNTNLTVTGTGTISLTSASSKTFAGGGISYSGITLDQGGAGTLTITGNNTFKDITNTYSATGATNITIGTTTQTVTQWTGTGTSGKVLTVQGTSASSPGTLVLSGATKPNVDYLTITGVRAYSLEDTWYAGTNSTNNGSLGWYFEAAPAAAAGGNFFMMFI